MNHISLLYMATNKNSILYQNEALSIANAPLKHVYNLLHFLTMAKSVNKSWWGWHHTNQYKVEAHIKYLSLSIEHLKIGRWCETLSWIPSPQECTVAIMLSLSYKYFSNWKSAFRTPGPLKMVLDGRTYCWWFYQTVTAMNASSYNYAFS